MDTLPNDTVQIKVLQPGFVDTLSYFSDRLGRQDIICSFLDSTQSLDLHSLSGTSNCTLCVLWII